MSKGVPGPLTESVVNPTDEIYRVLFSSIERRIGGRPIKTIAITSAVKGEGKTTTAIHLARSAARDFGKRVLLVECDLKDPKFNRYWSWPNGYGFYHILIRQVSFERAVQATDVPGLEVLPLGRTEKAAGVKGSVLSDGLRRIFEAADGRYDLLLIDAPPAVPLVDVRIIAEEVDGILMVVQAEGPPRSLVEKAVAAVPREKVLGVVFNGVKSNWFGYSYGYMY